MEIEARETSGAGAGRMRSHPARPRPASYIVEDGAPAAQRNNTSKGLSEESRSRFSLPIWLSAFEPQHLMLESSTTTQLCRSPTETCEARTVLPSTSATSGSGRDVGLSSHPRPPRAHCVRYSRRWSCPCLAPQRAYTCAHCTESFGRPGPAGCRWDLLRRRTPCSAAERHPCVIRITTGPNRDRAIEHRAGRPETHEAPIDDLGPLSGDPILAALVDDRVINSSGVSSMEGLGPDRCTCWALSP